MDWYTFAVLVFPKRAGIGPNYCDSDLYNEETRYTPVAQRDISGDTTEAVVGLVYCSFVFCIDSLISFLCIQRCNSIMQIYEQHIRRLCFSFTEELSCGLMTVDSVTNQLVFSTQFKSMTAVNWSTWHVYTDLTEAAYAAVQRHLFHSRYCLFEQSNVKITCMHFRVMAF